MDVIGSEDGANHHPSRIVFLVDISPLFDRPRDDILRAFEYQVRGWWLKKGDCGS